MGQWRSAKRAAVAPRNNLNLCANCPEPHVHQVHQTDDGHCAFRGCPCVKFKAIDTTAEEREVRRRNRQGSFGSRHERLTLTDVEICMVRGQSDVEELRRQVDIPLGLRAGSNSVFRADGFAKLKPGGPYTHRIYEPKGIRMPIYVLKRRICQLMYPQYEFVEISA